MPSNSESETEDGGNLKTMIVGLPDATAMESR